MKYKINNNFAFFSSPASKDSYGHVASIVCMSKHALLTATQATKGRPNKKRQSLRKREREREVCSPAAGKLQRAMNTIKKEA